MALRQRLPQRELTVEIIQRFQGGFDAHALRERQAAKEIVESCILLLARVGGDSRMPLSSFLQKGLQLEAGSDAIGQVFDIPQLELQHLASVWNSLNQSILNLDVMNRERSPPVLPSYAHAFSQDHPQYAELNSFIKSLSHVQLEKLVLEWRTFLDTYGNQEKDTSKPLLDWLGSVMEMKYPDESEIEFVSDSLAAFFFSMFPPRHLK